MKQSWRSSTCYQDIFSGASRRRFSNILLHCRIYHVEELLALKDSEMMELFCEGDTCLEKLFRVDISKIKYFQSWIEFLDSLDGIHDWRSLTQFDFESYIMDQDVDMSLVQKFRVKYGISQKKCKFLVQHKSVVTIQSVFVVNKLVRNYTKKSN